MMKRCPLCRAFPENGEHGTGVCIKRPPALQVVYSQQAEVPEFLKPRAAAPVIRIVDMKRVI